MQTQNRTLLIILIVAALLLCCCCFVVLGAFFGIGLFARSAEVTNGDYIAEVTRVVTVVPESNSPAATATPRSQATLTSPVQRGARRLNRLPRPSPASQPNRRLPATPSASWPKPRCPNAISVSWPYD